jgi:hypothetical protein
MILDTYKVRQQHFKNGRKQITDRHPVNVASQVELNFTPACEFELREKGPHEKLYVYPCLKSEMTSEVSPSISRTTLAARRNAGLMDQTSSKGNIGLYVFTSWVEKHREWVVSAQFSLTSHFTDACPIVRPRIHES